MAMKIIDVNARDWLGVTDFYKAVLEKVGAPDWHGQNVNALIDSMVYGGINTLNPPYLIRFHNSELLSSDIIDELSFVKSALEKARNEHLEARGTDVDIAFEII